MTDERGEVEAYLASLGPGPRAALQALRSTIAAAAPEATDTISYSMPAFRYRGRALVSYAAFRDHFSFFPMSGQTIDDHRPAVDAYARGKGTIGFRYDAPLPDDLVRSIVRARVAEIDAKVGASGQRAARRSAQAARDSR